MDALKTLEAQGLRFVYLRNQIEEGMRKVEAVLMDRSLWRGESSDAKKAKRCAKHALYAALEGELKEARKDLEKAYNVIGSSAMRLKIIKKREKDQRKDAKKDLDEALSMIEMVEEDLERILELI